MNKESLLHVTIGLIVGMGLLTFMQARADRVKKAPEPADNSRMEHTTAGHDMTMDGMVAGIKDLSGAEFDQEFVRLMIDHHQGAIDMSVLAEKQAQSKDVKKLAREIITAQEKEIDMMKGWQKAWEAEK